MTVLLDIAALSALALLLAVVPVLSARADARITRQLRDAESGVPARTLSARTVPATRRPTADQPARATARPVRHLSA